MRENIENFPKQAFHSTEQKLQQLAQQMQSVHLNQLFAEQVQRFENFSLRCEDLLFDFSKQRVNLPVIKELLSLADAKQLKTWISRLFSLEPINYTEQRAAMHWALRLPQDSSVFPEVSQQVHRQLD